MERDGLALAVVVGGQDDVVGVLEGPLQLLDVLLGVLGHLVRHARTRARRRRRARSWAGRGCARRRHGRCSHRPGTSRWSSPWRATPRRPGFRTYSVLIPSTREAEGGRRTRGASGRGRYHQVQRWAVATSGAGQGPPRSDARSRPGAGQEPAGSLMDPSEPGERRHRVAIFPGFSWPCSRCYARTTSPDRSEPALLAIFNDTVTSWIVANGYLAVFVLMLLESACVPIPSEVTMLFGGALASAGFAGEGQELSLFLVILAGTAGQPGRVLARLRGGRGGRAAAPRAVRALPAGPPARGRPRPRLVRAARRRGGLLRAPPAGDPHLHLPAGRHRADEPVRSSPSTPCSGACPSCR